MNGFDQRRERKKESIRQAAFQLFSKYGAQRVSIGEIAQNANVSQVTIYNYYGSKNALLIDTIQTFAYDQWKKYAEFIASDLPFPEKIEKVIFGKSDISQVLSPEFLESLVSNDPEITEFVEDFYNNKILPSILEFIEEGRNNGYINNNISTEAILLYLNIFREGTETPEVLGGQQENARLSKELSTLFFYGILGKPLNDDE